MVQEGEVYYDNTFEDELKVVEVDGDSLIIDDYVSGDGKRDYRKWELKHNINVGRFEKIREENIESEYTENREKEGIFDY
jgi:hypothetical protein